LQQGLSLQALLPERRALVRPATRDQQGARGVLAEPRAEEGGLPELTDDEVFHLARVELEVGRGRWRIGIREVEGDAVVRRARPAGPLPRPSRTERHREGPGRARRARGRA